MSTPIAYTRQTAAEAVGLSTDEIDRAIKAGDLVARKKGRRVVILRTELETWASTFEVKTA